MLAPISFRHVTLDWRRPYLMGVVNVTPDSFSAGGRHLDAEAAIAHGEALAAAGADILDIGGEATNPRAKAVDVAEELRRVLPVIEGLAARLRVPLSIDTTKATVARAAVHAGAEIVNDVSGGLFDPALAEAVAETGAAYVCGHLRGRSLAEVFAAEVAPTWTEVADELAERLAALPAAVRARTLIDPGLGFGKGASGEGNAALLRHSGDLSRRLGCPVLVGPSRKRFLAHLVCAKAEAVPDPAAGSTPAAALAVPAPAPVGPPQTSVPPDIAHRRRLTPPVAEAILDAATIGACLAAVSAGAHVLRVHDAGLLRAALIVYSAIRGS